MEILLVYCVIIGILGWYVTGKLHDAYPKSKEEWLAEQQFIIVALVVMFFIMALIVGQTSLFGYISYCFGYLSRVLWIHLQPHDGESENG